MSTSIQGLYFKEQPQGLLTGMLMALPDSAMLAMPEHKG
jgi:hypothetical protein